MGKVQFSIHELVAIQSTINCYKQTITTPRMVFSLVKFGTGKSHKWNHQIKPLTNYQLSKEIGSCRHVVSVILTAAITTKMPSIIFFYSLSLLEVNILWLKHTINTRPTRTIIFLLLMVKTHISSVITNDYSASHSR